MQGWEYLILDIGTTGIKIFLLDEKGDILFTYRKRVSTYHPHPSYWEQRGEEILEQVKRVIQKGLEKASQKKKIYFGLTNQRSTSLIWDQRGKPLTPAITWQDGRTLSFASRLNQRFWVHGWQRILKGLTHLFSFLGLPRGIPICEKIRQLVRFSFHTSLSAVHLAYWLQKLPVSSQPLCWGTLDSWILFHLSSKKLHITDPTHASATGLYDLFKGEWSPLLLKILKIPPSILPKIVEPGAPLGKWQLFQREVEAFGPIADQQASFLGLGPLEEGKLKCTMGTGFFWNLCTGRKVLGSDNGLVPMVAYQKGEHTWYLLEGMATSGGSLLDWAIQAGILSSYEEIDELKINYPQNAIPEVMIPAFSGLFAPQWAPQAKPLWLGFSAKTRKKEWIQSLLEVFGFQGRDILSAMRKEWGGISQQAWVDGGCAQSDQILQIMADLTGIIMIRPQKLFATALGVARIIAEQKGLEFPKIEGESYFYPRSDSRFRKKYEKKWLIGLQ
ncbi:MAG: hypothetical protein D6785_01455, partial [Planctomycetota bacterium]